MKKGILLFILSFVLFVPVAIQGQNTEIVKKADHAFKTGKYADAESLYKTATGYASGDDAEVLRLRVKKAAKAAVLQKEAEKAWGQGDKTTAIQKYEELLKLNPDDQTALSRINENNSTKELDNAMYYYRGRDYSRALECFRRAGSSATWNRQQLDAYRKCVEETDYAAWKRAPSISSAVRFLGDFPYSNHGSELKTYLFDYYLKIGQMDEASKYATTTEQRSIIADSRKNSSKRQRKGAFSAYPSAKKSLWDPKVGLAAELSLFGDLAEGALPLEFRLLNPNSVVNISVGARIGIRGMLKPDTLRYADVFSSRVHQVEASYSYCQLSPFVNVKIHLGKDVSSGVLFLGFTGRLNYNFNYTFSNTESEVINNNIQLGNKVKYRTKDLLKPITPTVVGEIGYGNENIELYLYYSFDNVSPIDFTKLMQLRSDTETPYRRILQKSSFLDRYTKDAFFGLGLRIYFGG